MNDVGKIAERLEKMQRLSEWDADKIVKDSQTVAEALTKVTEEKLKTQIRKFLDLVRKIQIKVVHKPSEEFDKGSVVLLKPKIVYAVSKEKNLEPLMKVLLPAIDAVHTKEDFEKLIAFVEGVIAYHAYESKKKSKKEV